jgi:hypothetical protein
LNHGDPHCFGIAKLADARVDRFLALLRERVGVSDRLQPLVGGLQKASKTSLEQWFLPQVENKIQTSLYCNYRAFVKELPLGSRRNPGLAFTYVKR